MTEVPIYFDLVSPYAFLALQRLDSFAREHGVRFVPKPVVYGALLNQTGLVGPVEVAVKRRYTLGDIRRCAALLGLPLVGPPQHPFRSLEAMRAICLCPTDADALRLAVALARACWCDGADLTDIEVLRRAVQAQGLDAEDLESRLGQVATKQRLIAQTRTALEAGVFGVPTFELDGELFWGHDRLDHLAARLHGQIPAPEVELQVLIDRPAGVVRRAPDEPKPSAD